MSNESSARHDTSEGVGSHTSEGDDAASDADAHAGNRPGPTERRQVEGLPRHVIGVAGVVVDEVGRVLTVRRCEPDRWELPGGALEQGETLHEGLVREVREEIGLEVEPVRLTGVYQNMALGPVALVFWCRRLGGVERLSGETREWRWVRRDELGQMMPQAWATRFSDALDAYEAATAGGSPGPVPVRVHDGYTVLSADR